MSQPRHNSSRWCMYSGVFLEAKANLPSRWGSIVAAANSRDDSVVGTGANAINPFERHDASALLHEFLRFANTV